MQSKGFFVTGTDTGCGKTEVSLALMRLLQDRGHRVLGMKPVASGAASTPRGLRNDDALRLQTQGSFRVDYERINPYAFAPPIAPHIAAAQAGSAIDIDRIAEAFSWLCRRADRVVVEGIGGWKVPLGPGGDTAQLARRLELPVILVVGLKLGCLNHALLSAESIEAAGARLLAWVANTLDPEMPERAANVATLEGHLGCPCLGLMPRVLAPGADTLAGYLRLPDGHG